MAENAESLIRRIYNARHEYHKQTGRLPNSLLINYDQLIELKSDIALYYSSTVRSVDNKEYIFDLLVHAMHPQEMPDFKVGFLL